MRKYVVATHASFAKGIVESLDFILGKQANLEMMCAYTTADFDIQKEIEQMMAKLDEQDELLVLVDLLGGSVANAFIEFVEDPRVHVITGVNFAMLLDMVMNTNEDIQQVIQQAMQAAQEGIVYLNEMIKVENNTLTEDDL